jgi:hypothetical protein
MIAHRRTPDRALKSKFGGTGIATLCPNPDPSKIEGSAILKT